MSNISRCLSILDRTPDPTVNSLIAAENLTQLALETFAKIRDRIPNPGSLAKILSETAKRGVFHSRPCHIGFSLAHHFDIICQQHSYFGLLINKDPEMTQFLRQLMALIARASDRHTFQTQLKKELGSFKMVNVMLTALNVLNLGKEGFWFSSEGNYKYIRQLILSKHLLAFTIQDESSLITIIDLLCEHGMAIDTVCLPRPSTERNLRALFKENPWVIFSESGAGAYAEEISD